MVTSLPPLALIAGPTASGKSALAVALAEATNGIVINADSAQIYAGLPIVTAAPTPADLARAEHRLYGVRDPADPCSAAQWADLAKAEIAQAHALGRLPILVGGTGLYLRTLLDGIAPIPDIDPVIRADVRAAGVAENLSALMLLDPCSASRLNAGDTTRIARALEVVRSTGHTIGHWQERLSGGIGDQVDLHPLIALPPRPWLVERIDRRFATMLASGAIDEVQALLARGLNEKLPAMRAIGVPELAGLVRGEFTRDQAIGAGQHATRRYAKRQYTWFANQPPAAWRRFTDPLDDVAPALALFALNR